MNVFRVMKVIREGKRKIIIFALDIYLFEGKMCFPWMNIRRKRLPRNTHISLNFENFEEN